MKEAVASDAYRKTVLENGLRVITAELPHTRSVSIGFFIGVGSRYEKDSVGGISHFLEHMLFKGTERRPTSEAISAAVEGVGGVFNANTGKEVTTYWAKVPAGRRSLAVDVLVDMLQHSKIEPEELERERRVIIEEINMILDDPDDWAGLLIGELLWPDHPLGREVIGTKDSISSIDRETVVDYLSRTYQPSGTVVCMAGRVEHAEVVGEIQNELSGWESEDRPGFQPLADGQDEPRVRVGTKDTEQAHVILSLHGIPRKHPDRFALRIMNSVLGEGMSSRLFLEVRERRGLAYSVHSYVSHLTDAGSIGVRAGVNPDRLDLALEAILRQLGRLRSEPVPATELEKAREYVKGRLELQMEDTLSVAGWLGQQEILDDRILTLDEVIASLDVVSADDVQRVAHELLLPEKLNLAVVGPFPETDAERLKGLLTL